MNNAGFGKAMENVRKPRNIKIVTTDRRRNYLVSEPRYRVLNRKYISNRIEKVQILVNKPVYLFVSMLDLSKI